MPSVHSAANCRQQQSVKTVIFSLKSSTKVLQTPKIRHLQIMNCKVFLCFLWSSLALAAIVGIDLGHQYTKAMMVAPGLSFDIVFTDEGKRKDLSTIYLRPLLNKDGLLESADRVFGSKIGSLCSRFPESCASNLKNLLGKHIDHETVKNYLSRHSGVSLLPESERSGSVSVKIGSNDKSFSFYTEELMAMTLNELKDRVLRELKSHPQAKTVAEDVAVSIAPYASQLTRIAYLDALHLANYSTVLGLVDEGTAVALGYLANQRFTPEEYDDEKVFHIIYDVGAGSTTATLFSYTPFKNHTVALDIESIGHDDDFGGEALTKSAYDILFSKFLDQFKLPKSTALSTKLEARLWEAAEKAKIILSANTDYKASLENFYDDSDFKAIITRAEFEDANADVMDRVTQPILDSLKNSPSGPRSLEEIQSVILNGGSTRTPFIQKQLTNLLGSEDKIAKVVNADEACAFGTTVRAYLLKMINSNPYKIELNDRVFSSFGYNVGGEEKEVFPRGSSSSSTSVVNFGPVNKDKLDISLSENGEYFKLYSLQGLKKKADSLKCKKSTPAEILATFTVDQNKMFDLRSVHVQCPEEVSESAEEVTMDSNQTNVTLEATKPKQKSWAPISVPESEFTGLKPLHHSHKKDAAKRLSQLKQKDGEKIEFDEKKNKLEAACYDLRSYLEEHEDVINKDLGEEWFERTGNTIGETLEWLEFESDGASVSELKVKDVKIQDAMVDAKSVVGMLDADLTMAGISRVNSEGVEISSQVQSYLLEYGKQVHEVRERYESAGFDFDAENEKIMRHIYGGEQDEGLKLDQHFKDFKEALKLVSELANLSKSKFDKVSRRERFEKSDKVKQLIHKMMEDVLSLQENHQKRLEFLLSKLQRLKERREQQEQKQEQKKKQKEQKEAEKKASAESVDTVSSETSDSNSSSETSTSSQSQTKESKTKDSRKADSKKTDSKSTDSKSTDTAEHDEL